MVDPRHNGGEDDPWRVLGRDLAERRAAAGLSQRTLAARLTYSRSAVANVETGRQRAPRTFWESCDQAVGATGALLAHFDRLMEARDGANADVLSALESLPNSISLRGMHTWAEPLENARPIGEEDILTIRQTVQDLVALEARHGANEPSRLAVRAFRAAHRLATTRPVRPHLEKELFAAVAELAELAGWQLFDAELQDAARHLNQEALTYARLAGDRGMERLIVQNMSTQSLHIGRPRESLLLARSIADDKLPPRLASLFDIRMARALAAVGDPQGLRVFGRAKSRFFDGVSAADPAWAWWVDERELACHEGNVHSDLGRWPQAFDCYARAVELTPADQPRNRYVYLRLRLLAHLHLKQWKEAETTTEDVLPYVAEVGSARNANGLRELVPIMRHDARPSSLRDAGRALEEELDVA